MLSPIFLGKQWRRRRRKGVPPKWAVWKRQARGWLSKGSNWVLQILQVLRVWLEFREHRIAGTCTESRVLIAFVLRPWKIRSWGLKEGAASRDAIQPRLADSQPYSWIVEFDYLLKFKSLFHPFDFRKILHYLDFIA